MRLQGRVAIITGAAGPVGSATALRFAREGAFIVLTDLASSHLELVAREIVDVEAGRALIALGDMRRPVHVDRVVREALEEFGRIDILVNGAGDGEEDAANSAWTCTEVIVPAMRERGWGRVINAIAADRPRSVHGPDDAMMALTRKLALEHARFGVTVNCVVHGAITVADATRDSMLALIPMGRFGQPRDVAATSAFLASDEASYLTGQVLFLDGGMAVAG